MRFDIIIEMLAMLVGGLGIFLLGMKNMSEGMQAVAGDRIRKIISGITHNRLSACLAGTMVTCMVQSSSVTTVLAVGMVNSGFMTLVQAAGVIMGANIGTTITGWLLVLKIGKYGLPLLGIAAVFFLFNRNERVRYIAMTVMGIGMVFFGLELMSGAFTHIREMPQFLEWFSMFKADSYLGMMKCVLAGCVLTAVVQSSSATLGITIGLAEAGIIPFPTAAALVLGENVGTTITALLASLGATTNARRAALFHSLFNVVGVFWITSIFPWYMQLINWVTSADLGASTIIKGATVYPYVRGGIALVHSGFNIANTLLFLPLLPLVIKLVNRIIADKKVKEPPRLTYLDVRLINTPALGIQQSKREILRIREHVEKMLEWLRELLVCDSNRNEKLEKKLFRREEVLDIIQKEITEFLGQLLGGNVPKESIREAHRQLRLADEYESISDYLAAILNLHLKRLNSNLPTTPEAAKEMLHLHDMVADYVHMVNLAVANYNPDTLRKARSQSDAITQYMRACRDRHLVQVADHATPPLTNLIHTEMLTDYRKVKNHALNIAEAMEP